MKTPLRLPASIVTAALAASMMASGCGVVKNREDRVVVAHENPSLQESGQLGSGERGTRDSEDESLRQLRQFLDLYTQNGNVTRQSLANFIDKYRAQILPFLQGAHMTVQELIDLVFAFDDNHDGQVSPQELSNGLMKRIPILRWIPDNKAAITREELGEQVAREYPQASQAARDGLADALMRYDQPFADGNGDGKLTRAEVSGAGLILSVLQQTDFSQGFKIPPGVIPPVEGHSQGPDGTSTIDITPIVSKLVQQKIDQQLFGRYAIHSSKDLSQDDLKLEWMQLALKFFLADKLVHHFAPSDGDQPTPNGGKILEANAQSQMSAWGIPQLPHWAQLRKIYDHSMMGGDADGAYNSIETFNYLTDLEFAQKVRAMVKGDFSAKALESNPQKQYLLAALLKLMPRTGEGLFMNDTDPSALAKWGVRTEYWDGFLWQFDRAFQGGNADGRIDDGEAAMGLLYAKLIENLYELFDTNHDTYLVRSEGNRLFAALGITDRRIIDAFYANIGLNTDSPSFWTKLRLFFSGDHGWHWLRPYDFHVRITQVLPRLLEKDQQ